MKSLRKKSKLLVEQILGKNFLDANSTLTSLILEAEENREEDVADTLEGGEGTDDPNASGSGAEDRRGR